jgi:hypothetical protein
MALEACCARIDVAGVPTGHGLAAEFSTHPSRNAALMNWLEGSWLRQGDVMTSQGTSVADAVRSIGVTEVTYHGWRQEYGGLKSDQVRRLKELELENQRLRRAVADLTLDKLILAEAARGNCLEPRMTFVPVSSTSGQS